MERLAKRLLNRGGRERVTSELLGRVRSKEPVDEVVYSTQQAQERRLDSEAYRKKVGLVSNVIRGHNPHDSPRASSRSSFYTWGGATCCDQQFRARTMRK